VRRLWSLIQSTDIYYLAFPHDRPWTKAFVYGLFILEVVQTIMIGHDAVATLGTGYGDPTQLDLAHLSWITIPLLSSIGKSEPAAMLIYYYSLFGSQRCCSTVLCMEGLPAFPLLAYSHCDLNRILTPRRDRYLKMVIML
jgi:hypothetical protein